MFKRFFLECTVQQISCDVRLTNNNNSDNSFMKTGIYMDESSKRLREPGLDSKAAYSWTHLGICHI